MNQTTFNEEYLRQFSEQEETAEALSELLERDSRRYVKPFNEENEVMV